MIFSGQLPMNALLMRSTSRYSIPGDVTLLGIIEWQIRDRKRLLAKSVLPTKGINSTGVRVRLAPDLECRNEKKRLAFFVWDGIGTSRTEISCFRILATFCSQRSTAGQNGIKQWLSCETCHWRLWRAAGKIWGYPRLEHSDDLISLHDGSLGAIEQTPEEVFSGNGEAMKGEPWIDREENMLAQEFRAYLPQGTPQ